MLKFNPWSELTQQTAAGPSPPRAELASPPPPGPHHWGQWWQGTRGQSGDEGADQGWSARPLWLQSLRLASPRPATGLQGSPGHRHSSGQSGTRLSQQQTGVTSQYPFPRLFPGLPNPKLHGAGARTPAPVKTWGEMPG